MISGANTRMSDDGIAVVRRQPVRVLLTRQRWKHCQLKRPKGLQGAYRGCLQGAAYDKKDNADPVQVAQCLFPRNSSGMLRWVIEHVNTGKAEHLELSASRHVRRLMKRTCAMAGA